MEFFQITVWLFCLFYLWKGCGVVVFQILSSAIDVRWRCSYAEPNPNHLSSLLYGTCTPSIKSKDPRSRTPVGGTSTGTTWYFFRRTGSSSLVLSVLPRYEHLFIYCIIAIVWSMFLFLPTCRIIINGIS